MARVGAVLCVVVVCLTGSAALAQMPHVRGKDGAARWLIDVSNGHSLTVSTLTHRLAESDVVVYVELVPIGTGTAQTALLNGHGPIRYVLISIDLNHPPDRLVEMLGHELQHAVEIAESPDVRDEAGLIALYKRIGLHPRRGNKFETLAAQEIGRRARLDLLQRPAELYARRGTY